MTCVENKVMICDGKNWQLVKDCDEIPAVCVVEEKTDGTEAYCKVK